jgi:hypothetical protein
MSTQIIWYPRAFDRMNRFVQSRPERKAEFAAALRALTLALSPSPEKAGESRDPPYRAFVHGNLAFWFRPAPTEDEAHIVWVHLRGQPD